MKIIIKIVEYVRLAIQIVMMTIRAVILIVIQNIVKNVKMKYVLLANMVTS